MIIVLPPGSRGGEQAGGGPEDPGIVGRGSRSHPLGGPQDLGCCLQVCSVAGFRWGMQPDSGEGPLIGGLQVEAAGEEIGIGFKVPGGPDVDLSTGNQLGKMGSSGDLAVGLQNLGSEVDLAISPDAVCGKGGAHKLAPDQRLRGCSNRVRIDGETAFMDSPVELLPCLRMRSPE